MIKIISVTLLVLFMSIKGHAQKETAKLNFGTMAYDAAVTGVLQAWVTQTNLSESRFNLKIHNPAGKRVRISLGGNDVGYLVNESFTGKVFSKVYNLSEMDDGTYNFEISSGKEKITKSVTIRTETTSRRIVELM